MIQPGCGRRSADVDPWLAINAAGFVRVDDAEREAGRMHSRRTPRARWLSLEACAERDVPFVTLSSDLVFDGRGGRVPTSKAIATSPLNVYGRSKQAAEDRRPGALAGARSWCAPPPSSPPSITHNFAAHVRRLAARGEVIEAADDLIVSPTYVPHLADAHSGPRHRWRDGRSGTWPTPARPTGRVSRGQSSRTTGGDASGVRGCPAEVFGWTARRPRRVALEQRARRRDANVSKRGLARYASDL